MAIEKQMLDADDAQKAYMMFKVIEENAKHTGRHPNIAGAAANFLDQLEAKIREAVKAAQKEEQDRVAQQVEERQAEVDRKAKENLQQVEDDQRAEVEAKAKAQAEQQTPPVRTALPGEPLSEGETYEDEEADKTAETQRRA